MTYIYAHAVMHAKTKVLKVVVTSHWPIFGVSKTHTLAYMIKTGYLA